MSLATSLITYVALRAWMILITFHFGDGVVFAWQYFYAAHHLTQYTSRRFPVAHSQILNAVLIIFLGINIELIYCTLLFKNLLALTVFRIGL